jgi:hypothetical protein
LWQLLSSYSLSSGVKYSSIICIVSLVSAVSDPSGFQSVVICVLLLLFPAADLYTSFQGLADVVMLQYLIPRIGRCPHVAILTSKDLQMSSCCNT